MKKILSIFFLIITVGCGTAKEPEIFRKSAFIMGTIINVTVVDLEEQSASLKIEKAMDQMRRIEKLMGRSQPSSDIVKINEAAGIRPVHISQETLRVIRNALKITPLTEGKFDITIGSLTNLWDFEKNLKKMFIPSLKDILRAKSLMGLEDLSINKEEGSVFLKRKMMVLDLGGIAKGYAVDRAVEILKREGIRGGIVDAGGDLRVFGLKPDGTLWRTGIQHPRKSNKIIAILELTDKVVVTSGDYERYFLKDGVRYHHILNPETGLPARGCQSVTIVTEDTGYADAMATGVFVLGPEKGMGLINDRKDMEGIIITMSGELLVSEGLRGKVEIL